MKLHVLVSVILVTCLTNQVLGVCPNGWVLGTFQTCYKFMTTPVTWRSAEGLCRDMGGSLVAVDTENKAAFITGYMINHGLDKLVSDPGRWWIGGFQTKDGMWQWTSRHFSGHAITNSRWYPNEPNNRAGIEGCVELLTHSNFLWNDNDCDHENNYICETAEVRMSIVG